MWNTDDEYLAGMTVHAAAKVLGLSCQSVFLMASKEKKLQAVKSGGTWVINPESVREYKKLLDTKRMIEQHRYI